MIRFSGIAPFHPVWSSGDTYVRLHYWLISSSGSGEPDCDDIGLGEGCGDGVVGLKNVSIVVCFLGH